MRRLKEGQHVTLHVGEDEHAARIEQIGEGQVVLGLAREPLEPLVHGTEALIEAVDSRGLHRVSGQLDPSLMEPDVVALRWVEVEDIQRRDLVRVETMCIVEIRREGSSPISTYTVNVSGSGFLLAGPDDLEVGELLEARVELGEGHGPLEVKGEVVRITGNGHRGVHITHITERDREQLVRYVFERQRSAPRVRLQ
jgi:hypothetical protein